MGNGSVIRRGEVQRMTAGTGITHSEFNPSRTEHVHLLQIWILPEREGLEPGYEQKAFPEGETRGALRLVASPNGRDGSVTIHQDSRIHLSLLDTGQQVDHPMVPGRHAWMQITAGAVLVNGTELSAGDGAAVSDETTLRIRAVEDAGFLLFDLP
jgi:redox-sensitive bicupin YhaK (pirin superfamily)